MFGGYYRCYAADKLLFAAVYQCTDAIQVIAAGAARIQRHAFDLQHYLRCLLAAWASIGYVLGMKDWIVKPMGAHGFWIGFIIGLTSAAIMLGMRLH